MSVSGASSNCASACMTPSWLQVMKLLQWAQVVLGRFADNDAAQSPDASSAPASAYHTPAAPAGGAVAAAPAAAGPAAPTFAAALAASSGPNFTEVAGSRMHQLETPAVAAGSGDRGTQAGTATPAQQVSGTIRSRLRDALQTAALLDPEVSRVMLAGYLSVRESLSRLDGLHTVVQRSGSGGGATADGVPSQRWQRLEAAPGDAVPGSAPPAAMARRSTPPALRRRRTAAQPPPAAADASNERAHMMQLAGGGDGAPCSSPDRPQPRRRHASMKPDGHAHSCSDADSESDDPDAAGPSQPRRIRASARLRQRRRHACAARDSAAAQAGAHLPGPFVEAEAAAAVAEGPMPRRLSRLRRRAAAQPAEGSVGSGLAAAAMSGSAARRARALRGGQAVGAARLGATQEAVLESESEVVSGDDLADDAATHWL